ncbi:MAG: DNA-3-methyladenine glycosylase 2 family protein [Xanthobacteraceae bacterium]
MPQRLDSEADLDRGLDYLLKADPRLKDVLAVAGRPPLRRRPGGFPGLVATVVGQQLSIASANAIWTRLADAFDPFEPAALRRARIAKLRRVGLSEAKIRAMRAIAAAVVTGQIDFEVLDTMEADAAHRALVAVHGIGPWTADSYLLFCLGHADAWPSGDLALQEAVRLAFALSERPNAKAMSVLAEPWQPWRGVAAFLLWSYYRAVKHRDPVLIPAST